MDKTSFVYSDRMSFIEGFNKDFLDNISEGVFILDSDKRIVYWNKMMERISGHKDIEVVGQYCHDKILMCVDPDGKNKPCQELCPSEQNLEKGIVAKTELIISHKSGHRVPVSMKMVPYMILDDNVSGTYVIIHDNSSNLEAMREIEKLRELSLIDPLTGVANRRFVEINLKQRFDELRRYGWGFGVVYMDIDGFKKINDNFGHDAGDKVLKALTKTLLKNVRSFDLIGRMGGDEFIAIIANTDENKLFFIADRLCLLVKETIIMSKGKEVSVTVSAGTTLAKKEDSYKTIMKRADELMYANKKMLKLKSN